MFVSELLHVSPRHRASFRRMLCLYTLPHSDLHTLSCSGLLPVFACVMSSADATLHVCHDPTDSCIGVLLWCVLPCRVPSPVLLRSGCVVGWGVVLPVAAVCPAVVSDAVW